MKKLAILVNIIAPYRIPIYNKLNEHFLVKILFSSMEGNRTTWDEIPENLNCSAKSSWGVKIPYSKKRNGALFETKYLHLTPGYFIDLYRYIPDVIISNEMGFRSLIALMYGWLFCKPVWIWWGGTIHSEKGISSLKKTVRFLFVKITKRWISYGKSSTDYLTTIGVSSNKILQIQNCIDEKLFCTPTSPVIAIEQKPVVLFVGHFIALKGIKELLEAFLELQNEGIIFSLLLVGDGPEKENIIKFINQKKIKNITILPPQNPNAMPAIYRSADILVFPTLKDVWGLVVNEALWSNLPVLSSIYAGCTQEIVPIRNHFDPLDQQNFINTLKQAINGDISPVDTAPLKTYDEVTKLIVDGLINDITC